MVACVTQICNSLLDKIVQFFLPLKLVNFLNTVLIDTRFMLINLWSIVHLGAGILYFFIWSKFSSNFYRGLFVWLIINIAFELFEFMLGFKGLYQELFLEEIADIIWDVIIGLLGYCLVWLFFWRRNF